MIRRLIAALLCALALPATAQSLDPTTLSTAEKRALQTVLAYGGYYEGLVDGGWGAGSRAALVSQSGAAALTRASAAVLVEQWDGLRSLGGWDIRQVPGTRAALGLPWDFVTIPQPGRLESDIGLSVEITTSRFADAERLHRELFEDRASGTPYRVDRPNLLITSVFLPGGAIVYLRSQPRGGEWTHVRLQVAAADEPLMDAMAGSIYFDEVPQIGVPREGALRSFASVRGGAEPLPRPPVVQTPRNTGTSGIALTGFHVAERIVLTAGEALRGCTRPLIAGEPSRLLAQDGPRGVTVLERTVAGRDWLTLSPDRRPSGNERAIGIPAGGDGLRARTVDRRGQSGRTRLDGFDGLVGGPVVDATDRVTALVATLDRGGRLVDAEQIRRFLDGQGIAYETRSRPASAHAVVPVSCSG